MTLEGLKLASENPNLPDADRNAARRELDRLEAQSSGSSGRQSHPLEAELFQVTGCVRLTDVTYGEIHDFCTARDWSDDAKSLYFERWLPAYMRQTAWGRQQLDKIVDYLARDDPPPNPKLDALINAWLALREVRRRFKASPEFAAMFTPEQVAELGLGKED